MRLLLVVVMLTGCAVQPAYSPGSWVKEGASAADLNQAQAQCEYEVQQQPFDNSLRSVVVQAYELAERRKMLRDLCMRGKGWQLI